MTAAPPFKEITHKSQLANLPPPFMEIAHMSQLACRHRPVFSPTRAIPTAPLMQRMHPTCQEIWKSLNLGIWKSQNLEIWKSGNQEISNDTRAHSTVPHVTKHSAHRDPKCP
jgi:hypothetical protein